jgi:2-polyprenyl-6-methoxyphenol hydroxylase-like FAD-dependent oxidoreductase
VTRTRETPVLIVGGGPVGLGLALDLGWRGVECLLVEQGDGSVEQPKIGHLAIRTMEYFRRWGIAKAVREAGFPDDFRMSRIVCTSLAQPPLYIDEHPSFRDMPAPVFSSEKKQRCPQHWLTPILRRAAEGHASVSLQMHRQLLSFEQLPTHVLATVRDGTSGETVTVRADYLVACDGYNSTVREALRIAMHGKPKLSYSISVLVRMPELLRYCHYGQAERHILIGPEGSWGIWTAIDGRELWRLTLLGLEEKLDLTRFDAAAWVRRALGRDDAPFEVLSLLPWRRSEMIAEHFGVDRVLIAGDAAHTMSPTGGMGMNTGMCDIANLGWKLQAMVDGWGGPRLLPSYETERRPVARRNAAASTGNLGALTSAKNCERILEPSAEGERVRREVGASFSAAMRASYWEPSGLQLGYVYDCSPIGVPDGTPCPEDTPRYVPTARPGSRAPHAWLADGRSTLDLFGRGFSLLCFDGAHARDVTALESAATRRGLPLSVTRIDDPEVARLYAQPLVMVRPDGHVAWRSDRVDDANVLIDTVRGG